MKHLKAILIDLNGTLHVENEIIAGTVEALKKYFFNVSSLYYLFCIKYETTMPSNDEKKL